MIRNVDILLYEWFKNSTFPYRWVIILNDFTMTSNSYSCSLPSTSTYPRFWLFLCSIFVWRVGSPVAAFRAQAALSGNAWKTWPHFPISGFTGFIHALILISIQMYFSVVFLSSSHSLRNIIINSYPASKDEIMIRRGGLCCVLCTISRFPSSALEVPEFIYQNDIHKQNQEWGSAA